MKFPNFLSIIFEEISSVRKEEKRLRTSRKLYAQKIRTGARRKLPPCALRGSKQHSNHKRTPPHSANDPP